jgi:hypothetical protein
MDLLSITFLSGVFPLTTGIPGNYFDDTGALLKSNFAHLKQLQAKVATAAD